MRTVWLSLLLIATTYQVSAGAAGQARTATESEVRAALARQQPGRTTFDAAAKVLGQIEEAQPRLRTRETQARYALYRFRAIDVVAKSIDTRRASAREQAWIAAHRSELAYSSPAGWWMVSADAIHTAHDTFSDTKAADDIAWFLAENGLPGECEGDVPCYASWANVLQGEYLRLHPSGRHVPDAIGIIAKNLDSVMDNLEAFPKVLAQFTPDRCGELHESLDPLIRAINQSASRQPAPALAATNRFARLCP